MTTKLGFSVGFALALGAIGSEVNGANFTICRGMCDASAVVTIGSEHFVVADDEDNILRVYSRPNGGAPQQTVDLSQFLWVDPKEPEADLEGAAPLGDRVYWISSHARNKNAKHRPSRHRFFATTIVATNGTVTITPVGFAYASLLNDLLNEPRLRPFNLAAAAQREPKAKDALNIEGLCATPEGALLIGFRNPNPNGKALLVPLLNPAELTEGKPARFGDPLLLDLGGRGIRSIARSGQRYFIVAGSYDGAGPSSLYAWNGGSEAPQLLPQPELTGLNPEAIEGLTENGKERLFVVSDDGTRKIGSQDCKDVKDPNLKYFRGTTVDL
jgi:hypothetical protein